MTGIAVLVVAGAVGQFGYAGAYAPGFRPGYGYGYGYGNGSGYGLGFGLSRPAYDPIGYGRFYNGAGYYTRVPTPVFPPKVITLRPGPMDRPGVTGRVVALDEGSKTITLRLPAETVSVRYGPATRFRAEDGGFPEVRPGALVNVDGATVTVLTRGDG